jgi:glucokinase
MTSKIIYEAAVKGDAIALKTFQYTAQKLGEALANIVAITSPEAIFLMGGLANAGDLLIKPTKEYMEKNMLFVYQNKTDILPSQLTKNVAIYGAAALIWNELNHN